MAMRKKTAGYWALNVVSILLAVIFIGPILWALAVSFQKEGKQIKSARDYFELRSSYMADKQFGDRSCCYSFDGNFFGYGCLCDCEASI